MSSGVLTRCAEFISRYVEKPTSPLILIPAGVIISLLVWRVWAFTVVPILRPNEPKELPYWIPIIGHGTRFLKDSQSLFTYGREYFGNTREPFVITVFGEKLYILTSPRDVSGVFKETSTLSIDDVEINRSFGISAPGTEQMTRKMFIDETKAKNEKRDYNAMSADARHAQLLPGPQLEVLTKDFMRLFEEEMRGGTAPEKYVLSSKGDSKVVSVKMWGAHVLIRATARALFGEALHKVAPQVTETFLDFDEKSWMILYNYPEFFGKKTYILKEELIQMFIKYLSVPDDKRSDRAWWFKETDRLENELGMDVRDRAIRTMQQYWVTNANSYKLAFWMLSYIVHSPSLKASVVKEILPALSSASPTTPIDIEYLLHKCPLLDSLYHDVLRLTASSSTYRFIEAPTTIRGKTFRKGRKLLIPQRQTLLDPAVFGNTAAEFDAERFMRNKELSRSTSFRPFGGGVSMCTGRFVAKREAFAFVGSVLGRWEVELEGNGVGGEGEVRFPRLNVTNPALGLMGPMN
ncbi:cytochrome P450, partial [Lepidopterella palustris CBS 459.81]